MSEPTHSFVTVIPTTVIEPRAYDHDGLAPASVDATDLLLGSCPRAAGGVKNATALFSSYDELIAGGEVYPSSDGFIRGAIDAWAQHQHFVIRPEHVWFEILSQMNFYMEKNAEKLRDLFVKHDGKEEIYIEDVSIESILGRFGKEIQKRVKTDWLHDWITPKFSTSTAADVLTANVLMMGMMKAYFSYGSGVVCGLPSVTLLGERPDWEKLLAKLDCLDDFGEEPKAYAKQLRPILSRFVRTFDSPDDPEIRNFWDTFVAIHEDNMCGAPPYRITGWLSGFLFWNEDGEPLHQRGGETKLDGYKYTARYIDENLPVGHARVAVKLRDFQGHEEFPAYIVAGNIGKRLGSTLASGYVAALDRIGRPEHGPHKSHGSVESLSGWLVYGPGDGSKSNKRTTNELRDLEKSLDRSEVNKFYTALGHRIEDAAAFEEYTHWSLGLGCESPDFYPGHSPYNPQDSPRYSPMSPEFDPGSPYSPASVQYNPVTPPYVLASPQYSPGSPRSPRYSPTTPNYSPPNRPAHPERPTSQPSTPPTLSDDPIIQGRYAAGSPGFSPMPYEDDKEQQPTTQMAQVQVKAEASTKRQRASSEEGPAKKLRVTDERESSTIL